MPKHRSPTLHRKTASMPFQPYPFQDSETRRKLEERRGKYGRKAKIEKGKGMGKVGRPGEGRRKKQKEVKERGGEGKWGMRRGRREVGLGPL